jgi:hypothetical protein
MDACHLLMMLGKKWAARRIDGKNDVFFGFLLQLVEGDDVASSSRKIMRLGYFADIQRRGHQNFAAGFRAGDQKIS